jgi:polyhydroxyalkanoate synthase
MNHLAAADAVVRETVQLGVELTKIAGGTSTVSPAAADRRFGDPAWSENPMYRRLAQLYLARPGCTANSSTCLSTIP